MTAFKADIYAWHPSGPVRRISAGDGVYYQACIRPDGAMVTYAGAGSGPPRIWCAGTDGTVAPEPLTPAESGARHPVFSADGARIAFTSDRCSGAASQTVAEMNGGGAPTHGNIFVMGSDGAGVVQLTDGPYVDQRPCFTRDGSRVLFVSNRAGRGLTLWAAAVDGSGAVEPLPYRGPAYRPWFSIDGEWLFFFRDMDGRHQICRLRPADEQFEPLPNDDDGNSHGPFADPAGKTLLMHSTRGGGGYRLWELPLDGTPPTRLEVPGYERPTHGTRGRNGMVTFDVCGR